MSDDRSPAPFSSSSPTTTQGFFSVEGLMIDDRPWKDAALNAGNNQRRIECGPAGPDRVALAAEYHRAHKLAGVPPGSIVRPRR
jgi:hypothetical protein